MARNARKCGPKQENQKLNPDQVYKKLEVSKKLACYNCFVFLTTAGIEGWDPEKAGSVFHYRESNYIHDNIKNSSWSRIGKVQSKYEQKNFFVVPFCLLLLTIIIVILTNFVMLTNLPRLCLKLLGIF